MGPDRAGWRRSRSASSPRPTRDRGLSGPAAQWAPAAPTSSSSPTAAWPSTSPAPTRRRSPPTPRCRAGRGLHRPHLRPHRPGHARRRGGDRGVAAAGRAGSPTFDPERMEALIARPNVHWLGTKPFAELPSYLGAIDVGLTPYAQSAFNRASFPLKTLEYLAAGRPAVASDLPAHRWLDIRTWRSPRRLTSSRRAHERLTRGPTPRGGAAQLQRRPLVVGARGRGRAAARARHGGRDCEGRVDAPAVYRRRRRLRPRDRRGDPRDQRDRADLAAAGAARRRPGPARLCRRRRMR